ncbi:hypothetical protein AGMMS49975_05920 [Clostridia bacterium]|nr:hypothetical protein AGMMS49975_05920 [Clostridia bacterium]
MKCADCKHYAQRAYYEDWHCKFVKEKPKECAYKDKYIDDLVFTDDSAALRFLAHELHYGAGRVIGGTRFCLLRRAAEKAERFTPKAVDYESVDNCIGVPICDGVCPNCHHCFDRVFYGDSTSCCESGEYTEAYEIDCNFCPNCGQALDWSVNNETT